MRFCNTPQYNGFYVLSTVTVSGSGTVVAHVRIRHRPGGPFSLEKIQNSGDFATLEELVEGVAAKLNLRKPATGRKYELSVWEHLQDEMRALELEYYASLGGRLSQSTGEGAMEMSGEGL